MWISFAKEIDCMILHVRQNNRPPKPSSRVLVVGGVLLMSLSALVWILNSEGFVQGSWSTIFNIIFLVLSVILGFLQWYAQMSSRPTTPPFLLVPRDDTTQKKRDGEIPFEGDDDNRVLILYSERYLYVSTLSKDKRESIT